MKRTLLGLMAVGLGVGLVGCSSSTGSRGLGSDNGNANGAPDADGDGIPDAMDPTPNGGGSGTPGGGGQPGGSGNPGGGEPDPGDNCEMHTVTNNNATPDMLIVLDKSGSMGGASIVNCKNPVTIIDQILCQNVDCADPQNAPRCGGGDRWGPSVAALKSITSELEATTRFGLMAYPADNSCAAGDLIVAPADNAAAQIASELDKLSPSGGTPTSLTLEKVQAVFEAQQAGPDDLPHPPYVLLVTDGDPNCVGDSGGGGTTDTAAQEASYAAITKLAEAGIKTYVIGYDTKTSSFASVLDEMARRGNTGDQAHRPVEDEASLLQAFKDIAKSAISCEFVLDEPAPDPSFVLVEVDNNQINLNDPNGWVLSPDNRKITVQGATCETLKNGAEHILNVEVQCNVVVPI